MEAISVHGAEAPRPFTITHEGTVADLHAALGTLIKMGYGGTTIMRCDAEAGPCSGQSLELYDTSKEKERGEVDADMIFLIC